MFALSRPFESFRRLSRLFRGVDLGGRLDVQKQRRALGRLDEAILRDIGVSAQEAQAEADRPLWDAPASWKK